MKSILVCCIVFFLFCLSSCKHETQILNQITEEITSLKKVYAPDKRTRIFDINPKQDGDKIILKGETAIPEAKEELLQKLSDFKIIDSIEILPSKELGHELFGVVTIPVANMRSNPGHSSELSNQLICGVVVRLFKIKGTWLYCQTPDDYLGWIDLDAITPMDSIKLNDWYSANKVIVHQDQTYLFADENTVADILTPLSSGAVIKLIEAKKDKSLVALPDGRQGYISNQHFYSFADWKSNHKEGLHTDALIKDAYALLGRPYLWGGTSVNGVDCSGFTKTIFFKNGFVLPRDASQQVHVGMPIETDTTFENLKPGDLLFFGRKAGADQPEKITHVAMYLGNSKIIHASGYVKVESLKRGDPTFAENRLKTFVRATRPAQSPKEHGIPAVHDIGWYK